MAQLSTRGRAAGESLSLAGVRSDFGSAPPGSISPDCCLRRRLNSNRLRSTSTMCDRSCSYRFTAYDTTLVA